MFTIGFLTEKEPEENMHLIFLAEKGWNLPAITINEVLEQQRELDAVVVLEETVAETCSWLIKLKKRVQAPIYLLSAINESRSNIVYLQLGAEACFPMKMEAEELYYTLTNLLTHYSRKSNSLSANTSTLSKQKEIELVPRNLSVLIDGKKEVSLTKKEYNALELLYNSPSQTISYDELREKLWNSEMNIEGKNYRVANIMFHIRNKIEISTTNPRFIKTVRSKGYMLDIK